MKIINVVGLMASALAVSALGSPVSAADLNNSYGGSIKDDGYVAQPTMRSPAGPCYVRGDLGHSWSRAPGSASWPVTNSVTDNSGAVPVTTYVYAGDSVTDTSMGNSWFGGVGLGCGSGSRGVRGEVMLNQTGWRNFQGTPLDYNPVVIGTPSTPITDPIHTSVKSTTLMFNGYKDLGTFGAVTPYLGAGVGVAYNKMSEVYFTNNPALTNQIEGASRLSLAWSLMAGIGYQLNDRAVLDFGYRYMDYGKATSGRIDNTGAVNPALQINDIAAHEFKVGLRYHFGGSEPVASYQPMK